MVTAIPPIIPPLASLTENVGGVASVNPAVPLASAPTTSTDLGTFGSVPPLHATLSTTNARILKRDRLDKLIGSDRWKKREI
jgi:hypothetical protein